ncbi:BTAD domain-containing putative transcriptional regulator [Streptomyces sp. NPDC057638]|uniref:AfsR/SARP family transcriptional regulator n=1 Tax=Streptomyces sp. NPDC057638 TaxID=3346190 RepID=UPI0036AE60CD
MASDAGPGTAALRFSVLGPLTVYAGREPLRLGPLKQRLLLASLLCRPGRPVPVDTLTDTLWEDAPPRTARKNLQVYVSTLRGLLDTAGAPGRLLYQTGGYLLHVQDDELDTLRFQGLVRAGREALGQGAPASAARLLREALDLWRGPALPELRGSRAILAEGERLDARHLQVYEDWAEAELDLGNAARVADTVADLVEQHPLRERLRAIQMNALRGLGRRTEAFAVYEGLRQLLASELGLRPSASLQVLYRSLLDGADRPSSPGRPGPGGRGGGPGPAPGPRTLLPPQLPDFTGRRDHVRELLDSLAQPERAPWRAAVVTGCAGMGKTATAVHIAHRLAEVFPDGRLLVRMRDADGTPRPWPTVLAELDRLAGTAPPAPGTPDHGDDPDEAAARWRGRLAHRRLLVVLDDAADESAVRPLLPETGASAVIVTARPQLSGLAPAHRVALGALGEDEALDLLGAVIGAARLRTDPAAARRIVVATGMLPLAVRVCGLKLAVLRHLPLAEYAARLADDRALLDELAAGDIRVRPRLASGWRDLPEAGRIVLGGLGNLPGPDFTLAEAATALACETDEAGRKLEALMDAGVIVPPDCGAAPHTLRFTLPRLLRLYAREQSRSAAPEQGRTPRRPGGLPESNRLLVSG